MDGPMARARPYRSGKKREGPGDRAPGAYECRWRDTCFLNELRPSYRRDASILFNTTRRNLPTGYIGVTEAKLPKGFHLSNVVTFPKKTA
jgi:hypothetical protein